ncbi:MAG: hypothetical protein HYY17_09775 [Planctomycetes bacterium]|nr:hypothetical protein [Planctomycetota bacterium]
MRRALGVLLLLAAACSTKKVPEDHWYPHAEMLCQERRCPSCHGTRGVTCFKCHGSGEITCTSCRGSGKRTCSKCDGSGRYKGDECDDCDGKGQKKCYTCGGDGKETCPTCSGKGKIACLQLMPVTEPPVASPDDAWPANNFQGAGEKKK